MAAFLFVWLLYCLLIGGGEEALDWIEKPANHLLFSHSAHLTPRSAESSFTTISLAIAISPCRCLEKKALPLGEGLVVGKKASRGRKREKSALEVRLCVEIEGEISVVRTLICLSLFHQVSRLSIHSPAPTLRLLHPHLTLPYTTLPLT